MMVWNAKKQSVCVRVCMVVSVGGGAQSKGERGLLPGLGSGMRD